MSVVGLVRKLSLAAVAASCLFLGIGSARADSINYVATSTYTSASTSAYSASNTPFKFTFTEPGTLSSLSTSVPFTFTLGSGACCTYSGTGDVTFYSVGQLGLFDISALIGGDTFTWEFFGPQLYTGSNAPYTLQTGTFAVDSSPAGTFSDSKGKYSGSFSGGTVVATKTPEPATLLMLVLGLLFLSPLAFRRERLAAQEGSR